MTAWPGALREWVQRLGARVVWLVGLRALGYPPTWITTGTEVLKLNDALFACQS